MTSSRDVSKEGLEENKWVGGQWIPPQDTQVPEVPIRAHQYFCILCKKHLYDVQDHVDRPAHRRKVEYWMHEKQEQDIQKGPAQRVQIGPPASLTTVNPGPKITLRSKKEVDDRQRHRSRSPTYRRSTRNDWDLPPVPAIGTSFVPAGEEWADRVPVVQVQSLPVPVLPLPYSFPPPPPNAAPEVKVGINLGNQAPKTPEKKASLAVQTEVPKLMLTNPPEVPKPSPQPPAASSMANLNAANISHLLQMAAAGGSTIIMRANDVIVIPTSQQGQQLSMPAMQPIVLSMPPVQNVNPPPTIGGFVQNASFPQMYHQMPYPIMMPFSPYYPQQYGHQPRPWI